MTMSAVSSGLSSINCFSFQVEQDVVQDWVVLERDLGLVEDEASRARVLAQLEASLADRVRIRARPGGLDRPPGLVAQPLVALAGRAEHVPTPAPEDQPALLVGHLDVRVRLHRRRGPTAPPPE